MHLLRLRFYTLFPLSYRQEYTEHIRSIYGAYTCIYVHIRAYTGHFFHIRSIYGAFFSIYGAYTGHFLHIRSIYGAFFCIYGAYTGHYLAYTGPFFCIYGAYTEHIRAYTCIYGAFFPDTENIRGIYEHIRYVLEKINKIYFG